MRSIDDLITSHATLHPLRDALASREVLLRRVRGALPDELVAHCIGADLDGRELRLLADAAGWATRLRYFGRDLMGRLRADGIAISVVEVRVAPPDTRSGRSPPRVAMHSDEAALCVEGAAEGVEDPTLRAALRRLGRRLRR